MTKILTAAQYEQLLNNGKNKDPNTDFFPVVHLTWPGTKYCWLLTELDLEDQDIVWGLCYNGFEPPGMGYFYLDEWDIVTVPPFKSTLHNNLLFKGKYPISVYEAAAKAIGRIVLNDKLLEPYASKS